jgi:hypothetical protein
MCYGGGLVGTESIGSSRVRNGEFLLTAAENTLDIIIIIVSISSSSSGNSSSSIIL